MRTLLLFSIAYPQVVGVLALTVYFAFRYGFRPDDQGRTDWLLAATVLVIPANILAELITGWMSLLRPWKYDLYVYRIDGLLGFQPSFLIGQLVHRHLALVILVAVSYGALSLAMLAVYAGYVWNGSRAETITVIKAFALNLFAALPIYALIPVCGPAFAFPKFPAEVATVPLGTALISAPPNGIPSVHFSSALLIAAFAWRWKWGRVLSLIYVVLMALATLGSGQHYLLDLVLAVPYSFAVYRICTRSLMIPADTSTGSISAAPKVEANYQELEQQEIKGT